METSLAQFGARQCASVLLACCALLRLAGPLAAHPLDPLSWQEHWAALKVLADEKKIDSDTRFARLALSPPDKQAVWAWSPGQTYERAAEAVIKQGSRTFEAVIDLRANRLARWTEIPGAQIPWLEEEYQSPVLYRVMDDPQFQAALKRRAVEHPEFLECAVNPTANLGKADQQGRRIGIVTCTQRADLRNETPRAIEGLYILVDVNTGDIVEITDEETVTAQGTAAEYDLGSVKNPRGFATPIEIHQPGGPAFKVSGNEVEWDRWRFHLRSDQRVGLILSTVVWDDGTRRRPVLYEGYLSEIFVPYMAPQMGWASRTHLDVGENSSGGLSDTLEPGVHCPSNAVYFDAIVTQDNGWPKDKRRVVCLFERYAGDVAWLHGEEGRQRRVLVARMSAKAGNYDYLIDWTFQTDGEIRITVGATGLIGVRTTVQKNVSDGSADDELYGRYVADHLVGVNHSHFFNFRLDLDVDGPSNAFYMDRLTMASLPKGHPRGGVWTAQPHIAQREHDVMQHGADGMALWRMASAAAKNSQGYATSYQIVPSHSGHSPLMAEMDIAAQRAGFIAHDLWVTPRSAGEHYAAGDYPTLSKPGEGLPRWTRDNRPIENRDTVVWYTIGMHHVVRAEDWPVMPTVQHSVSLRPFDFFDSNPAIDTRPEP